MRVATEGERCDWCHEWATRITHHERANAGHVVAYWCERHYHEAHPTQTVAYNDTTPVATVD